MSKLNEEINDCWNTIGVWSNDNRCCEMLAEVGHCINCEVFAAAGRRLLDVEAPKGYVDEWRDYFSAEQEESDRETGSIILFRLGDEWLGIETKLLDEVMPMRTIHTIPHRKSQIIRGLTNVRGELQVCVSLGRLMNITRGEVAGSQVLKGVYERMVVASNNGVRLVFPVSEVKGVHRFDIEDIQDAPATAINCSVHYLKGMLAWENRHVGIIDHELVFPAIQRGLI